MTLLDLQEAAKRLESEIRKLEKNPHIKNPEVWLDTSVKDGKTRYRKRYMQGGKRKSQTIDQKTYYELKDKLYVGRQLRDRQAVLAATMKEIEATKAKIRSLGGELPESVAS